MVSSQVWLGLYLYLSFAIFYINYVLALAYSLKGYWVVSFSPPDHVGWLLVVAAVGGVHGGDRSWVRAWWWNKFLVSVVVIGGGGGWE